MSSHDPNPWQQPGTPSTPPPPPPPPAGRSVPPPPPPPSAGPPGYPPASYGYGTPPPGYVVPAQPPRPATPVAAWLMLAGAVLLVAGCVLPWLSGGGTSINGFDEFIGLDDDSFELQKPGPMFVFFAVVMAAFAVTTFAARRLLAIMIIGIVVAAFASISAAAELAHYSDYAVSGVNLGAGLPAVLAGALLALAGAITGCAKRRRW